MEVLVEPRYHATPADAERALTAARALDPSDPTRDARIRQAERDLARTEAALQPLSAEDAAIVDGLPPAA